MSAWQSRLGEALRDTNLEFDIGIFSGRCLSQFASDQEIIVLIEGEIWTAIKLLTERVGHMSFCAQKLGIGDAGQHTQNQDYID